MDIHNISEKEKMNRTEKKKKNKEEENVRSCRKSEKIMKMTTKRISLHAYACLNAKHL